MLNCLPFALSWLPRVPDRSELSLVDVSCFREGSEGHRVTVMTPIDVYYVVPENVSLQ